MIRPSLLRSDRWPLARRLAASMMVVAATAIVVLFFYLSRVDRREIAALQRNNLINNAQAIATGLDALVNNETGRIKNLAVSRAVVEFATVRPAQRSALFTPTLADFSNFLDSGQYYRAVLLLGDDGEVLLSTQGSYVGQRFGSSAFFQQARRGEAFMSDPGIGRLDRTPVIWLSAPVYTSERAANAAPIGVVAVALSPEWLWQYIDRQQLGEHGYAMLVDQYGIRLAHGADHRYIFRSLAPLPPPTWAQLQAEDRFADLPMMVDTGSDTLWQYVQHEQPAPVLIAAPGPGSGNVYYSAARLATHRWTVVAMLGEQEILAPADRVTWRGLQGTLVVAALLAITVWWMAQRIVRPVPQLAHAATQIAHGDLSTPVAVRGSSELHALAENFEIMRQRLQQSHVELAFWANHLEQRVAQRSAQLGALGEVVSFASRTQSRDELLHTALHHALRVMGADMGGIWIADERDALRLMARDGLNHALSEPLATFAPGEGLLGQVQAQGVPIALDDISQAPRLARAVIAKQGLHAFAAVPLRIHGRTLGVMGMLSRSKEAFPPEAVALAAAIAQQIALTLDNLALVEQVQAQARHVASLEERERIAGEIHDSVAQTLGYLYLQTDRLANDAQPHTPVLHDQLLNMQQVLAAASHDVRQFIARLHDGTPPPACLPDVLRDEVARGARELALHVDCETVNADTLLVSAATGTETARIVGEALRNAKRHGQAETVRVLLQHHDACTTLRISDNGVGFDPDVPLHDGRSHWGLQVMRARAQRIGGTCTITSQPGAGTTIEVRWRQPGNAPVEENAA